MEQTKRGRVSLPERVRRQHGRPFAEVLREYCEQPMTPEEVAVALDCSVKSLFEHGSSLGLKIVRRVAMSNEVPSR